MGLQLKGGNNEDNKTQNSDVSALDKRHEDPWGNKDIEDDFYKVNMKAMVAEKKTKDMWARRSVLGSMFRIAVVTIILIAVVLACMFVNKKMHPVYKELSPYIGCDEAGLSKELGVELTESDTWMSDIFWWVSDRKIKTYCNEDVGVFYFDNKLMGLHVRTDKYKLFGIQVGMGDKTALKIISYKYDNYYYLDKDLENSKKTTYYYYNKDNNDCIGLTQNDATNLIEGITYINNYQYLLSHVDEDDK